MDNKPTRPEFDPELVKLLFDFQQPAAFKAALRSLHLASSQIARAELELYRRGTFTLIRAA